MGAMIVLIELFRKYFHFFLLTLSADARSRKEKKKQTKFITFLPLSPVGHQRHC